ncbi:phosphatase 2C-like domain-containing protein [Tribonema minus]|uniref:Phosphatase 2C-like domain-containing protein n=1 Tax=Tribonema minus TaxID=303371 RepID=A0A835YMQ6_9STRA|nr:phosphatase 2C-like domain-containing protein [Tribonema minus]
MGARASAPLQNQESDGGEAQGIVAYGITALQLAAHAAHGASAYPFPDAFPRIFHAMDQEARRRSDMDVMAAAAGLQGQIGARSATPTDNLRTPLLTHGDVDPNSSTLPLHTPLPPPLPLPLPRASASHTPLQGQRSGCTAVVAVVDAHENVVNVAHAGDSRAVLCRGGAAVALTHDHKPTHTVRKRCVRASAPGSGVEKVRIEAAGGFVTAEGRVNGNLNLSRTIGDLGYKNNHLRLPKDQIISAEPDTCSFRPCAEDEFLLLACDGVWEVMSNQQAVDLVRRQLERAAAAPPAEGARAAARALAEACVSRDPVRTRGRGCDNMTAVVVRFEKGLFTTSSCPHDHLVSHRFAVFSGKPHVDTSPLPSPKPARGAIATPLPPPPPCTTTTTTTITSSSSSSSSSSGSGGSVRSPASAAAHRAHGAAPLGGVCCAAAGPVIICPPYHEKRHSSGDCAYRHAAAADAAAAHQPPALRCTGAGTGAFGG